MTERIASPSCFDAGRSHHPTRIVAAVDVIDLLVVPHAPERIEEYRRAMLAGAKFPPVSVVSFAGRLLLADGHKRFSAFRELGGTHLVVEIWPVWRWLADQAGQFRRKAVLQVRLSWRSLGDPTARAEARALGKHFMAHWLRIARSLRATLRS